MSRYETKKTESCMIYMCVCKKQRKDKKKKKKENPNRHQRAVLKILGLA